jgi:hypothetical protein
MSVRQTTPSNHNLHLAQGVIDALPIELSMPGSHRAIKADLVKKKNAKKKFHQ